MADSDKLFQDAINQINAVTTPDVDQMKVKLQRMVQAGIITPAQMQTALVDKNAYDNIMTNPSYTAAQQNALAQMQAVAEEGGLTPIDKAQLQDITDEQNTVTRGRNDAVMQNLRERGVAGGGLELQAKLANEQSGADRAARQGLDVAAEAQKRALEAMQESGTMATNLRGQDFSEQAAKASSQNAIDEANAAMTNQARQFNTNTVNAAQERNLAEKQRISDTNTDIGNAEEEHNKSLYQQDFENRMAKANAIAGQYTNWGNQAAQTNRAKRAFQNARDAKLVQTGANLLSKGAMAFGGGAPGAAGAGGAESAPAGYSPNVAPNQYASLGYSKGGKVPGQPNVPGDSPDNDTVPAKLSPGEVVVPRTAAQDPELLSNFVKNMKGEPRKPKAPKTKEIDHKDIANVFRALVEMKGGK